MTKKELRAAMRRRNLGMDAAERAEASRRIFGRAGRLEAFGAARTVGVFCSLPDEPDTAETLARWSAVKRIVVPRVEGDVMRFCEYDPQTLRPGAFGIAEPGPEAQTCDPSEIDLVIVPGTAFTAAGRPLRPRPGLLRQIPLPAGRARRESRRVLCPPTGRGAACGAARRGDGLHNNGLNDGCERVCLRLWRGVRTRRGTAVAVLVFGRAGACRAQSRRMFFKALAEAREGSAVSLNAANIGCGGGKFYTGFAPMPPFVPAFVSQKEHYKQTPEMVLEFIGRLGVPEASGAWLNFARIDTPQAAEAFGTADGALFFATPDILSGLVSWAVYDNNADDAVCAPFGSGCSAVVTQAVRENRRGGRSVFLALFDPSVRPWVDASELGFVAPMSRLREMCGTMRASCLFGTHAWNKVRVRINGGNI